MHTKHMRNHHCTNNTHARTHTHTHTHTCTNTSASMTGEKRHMTYQPNHDFTRHTHTHSLSHTHTHTGALMHNDASQLLEASGAQFVGVCEPLSSRGPTASLRARV
jgi:hypothetical protein